MIKICLYYFDDNELLKKFENNGTKTKRFNINNFESLLDRTVNYTAYKKISCVDINKLRNLNNISIFLSKISDQQQLDNIFHQPYFLMKKSFPNIDQDIPYIRSVIKSFLLKDSDFKLTEANKFLFRNRRDINIEVILEDIEYLEQNGVLTSRLAIFIYKITTFNYIASDKAIGQFYADRYGKSKNYTCKQYDIRNVKGYRVRNYDFEYAIKIKIARNFRTNPYCRYDINCLSQAIGLSIEELNNLS